MVSFTDYTEITQMMLVLDYMQVFESHFWSNLDLYIAYTLYHYVVFCQEKTEA